MASFYIMKKLKLFRRNNVLLFENFRESIFFLLHVELLSETLFLHVNVIGRKSSIRFFNFLQYDEKYPEDVKNYTFFSNWFHVIFPFFCCSRLKSELAMLRKRGLLANGHHHPPPNNANLAGGGGSLSFTNSLGLWNMDPNRSCGRCRSELGRIMNRGAFCRACNVRVCKSCREYGMMGRNGTSDWLCTICYKNR